MPSYQQYQNQEYLRPTDLSYAGPAQSDGTDALAFILGYTLLSSYFMARASENNISTRQRTLFFAANSITNLYMFQYIGTGRP